MRRKLASAAGGSSGWQESRFSERAWAHTRTATRRWALAGLLLGGLLALVANAPAAWLAQAVASSTQQRLLLADARGTVWAGSAVAVLTGGPDSKDASALPGRLNWALGPRWDTDGLGFALRATQPCCLNGVVTLVVRPGLGRVSASLLPVAGWVGQWPSAWLGGLGTPWNTLQLGGMVRLTSPGLTLESVQGRWRLAGQADVELAALSSRLSILPTLGSYRLAIAGEPAGGAGAEMTLTTLEGALQLTGSGTWAANGVRFRGEAAARAADEVALANLLNIIGRRNGARSLISIG